MLAALYMSVWMRVLTDVGWSNAIKKVVVRALPPTMLGKSISITLSLSSMLLKENSILMA